MWEAPSKHRKSLMTKWLTSAGLYAFPCYCTCFPMDLTLYFYLIILQTFKGMMWWDQWKPFEGPVLSSVGDQLKYMYYKIVEAVLGGTLDPLEIGRNRGNETRLDYKRYLHLYAFSVDAEVVHTCFKPYTIHMSKCIWFDDNNKMHHCRCVAIKVCCSNE